MKMRKLSPKEIAHRLELSFNEQLQAMEKKLLSQIDKKANLTDASEIQSNLDSLKARMKESAQQTQGALSEDFEEIVKAIGAVDSKDDVINIQKQLIDIRHQMIEINKKEPTVIINQEGNPEPVDTTQSDAFLERIKELEKYVSEAVQKLSQQTMFHTSGGSKSQVQSVHGRKGNVVAEEGDYSQFYASLDENGTVPVEQLPESIKAGLVYKGVWDADQNTPDLSTITPVQGDYYVVNVAGNTVIDGNTDWQVGDWVLGDGTAWDKLDNNDAITSVAGKTGDVVLEEADITDLDKYSQAEVDAALALKTDVGHGHDVEDITDFDTATLDGGEFVGEDNDSDFLPFISSIRQDTTPSLGGNLDTEGSNIFSSDGNVRINNLIYPTTDGTQGQLLTTDGAGRLKFITVGSGGGAVDWDSVLGKPSVFPPEAHTHTESDITDLDKYTQAEVDAAIAAIDGGVSDWADIENKPTEFPPEAHTHLEADITDLDKYTKAEVDAAVSGASDDAASVKTKYESNADTNAFTDADQTYSALIQDLGQFDETIVGDNVDVKTALQQLESEIVVRAPFAAEVVVFEDFSDALTAGLEHTDPIPIGTITNKSGSDGGRRTVNLKYVNGTATPFKLAYNATFTTPHLWGGDDALGSGSETWADIEIDGLTEGAIVTVDFNCRRGTTATPRAFEWYKDPNGDNELLFSNTGTGTLVDHSISFQATGESEVLRLFMQRTLVNTVTLTVNGVFSTTRLTDNIDANIQSPVLNDVLVYTENNIFENRQMSSISSVSTNTIAPSNPVIGQQFFFTKKNIPLWYIGNGDWVNAMGKIISIQ